jgi:5'-nucleotidase
LDISSKINAVTLAVKVEASRATAPRPHSLTITCKNIPSDSGADRPMRILLTNDDGVYAPGLAALATQLRNLGDVEVIAPAVEQSGVGHSITFLSPLVCKEIFRDGQKWAWAVEGSPADCVKLAIGELLSPPPDLVVSGINNGLNAGINVLYSGTVAAAIEGAFFGITSIAVSLEYDPHNDFLAAAVIARNIIEQLIRRNDRPGRLYNINIPQVATTRASEVRVVPMGMSHYGSKFIRRQDPKGRDYYWASPEIPPQEADQASDLMALYDGYVTVTPLHFDLTELQRVEEMKQWGLKS